MEYLINITATFTVTATLILLFKFIFKDKFTPKWHVMIWLILVLRLFLPSLPESEVSIFNMIPNVTEEYNSYIKQPTFKDGSFEYSLLSDEINKQSRLRMWLNDGAIS